MATDDRGTRTRALAAPDIGNVLSYVYERFNTPKRLWNDDGLAYHYTDSNGLLGIIDKKKFWATNSLYLNDPTELSYCVDKSIEHLRNKLNACKDSAQASLLTAIISELTKPRDVDLYIVSFCRQGDLLSQWRGYGSFGRGYAIGFRLADLEPHGQFGMLAEVSYDEKLLISIIEEIWLIFSEHTFLVQRWVPTTLAELCAFCIISVSEAFKHPSYHEESEVRLIYRRSNSIHRLKKEQEWFNIPISYRSKGGEVVSYIETGLDFPDQPNARVDLPLCKLIVGPGNSFNRNEGTLKALLHSRGYRNVEVVPSGIPFRA